MIVLTQTMISKHSHALRSAKSQSDMEKKLDALMNELFEVKATMTEITKFHLVYWRSWGTHFSAAFCHVSVKPPVIITKCCKTVLGCSTCVNAWYSGQEALTKSCPNCRAPRGYNETMLLHGLDDFKVPVRNTRRWRQLIAIIIDYDLWIMILIYTKTEINFNLFMIINCYWFMVL